jgi:hypothetical protein
MDLSCPSNPGKSKVRHKFQELVKFIAKDPLQSHSFNNNQSNLDVGLEQFGLNSSYPLTGRAELGAVISVTYGSGWFAPTYTYDLTEFGAGAFRYEARADHPFVGGGRVSVAPLANGCGSVLKWDGLYMIDVNDDRGRRYFKSFSADFFAALDRNLRKFEAANCR